MEFLSLVLTPPSPIHSSQLQIYQLQRSFIILFETVERFLNANCGDDSVYDYASVQVSIVLEKAM
jgi:hypothetical protein